MMITKPKQPSPQILFILHDFTFYGDNFDFSFYWELCWSDAPIL